MANKETQGKINEQLDQKVDPGGKRIPRMIWVQWYGDGEPEDGIFDEGDGVTWCVDKINKHDVCYVTEESAVVHQQRNHAQGYREGWAAAGEAIAKELAKL